MKLNILQSLYILLVHFFLLVGRLSKWKCTLGKCQASGGDKGFKLLHGNWKFTSHRHHQHFLHAPQQALYLQLFHSIGLSQLMPSISIAFCKSCCCGQSLFNENIRRRKLICWLLSSSDKLRRNPPKILVSLCCAIPSAPYLRELVSAKQI